MEFEPTNIPFLAQPTEGVASVALEVRSTELLRAGSRPKDTDWPMLALFSTHLSLRTALNTGVIV